MHTQDVFFLYLRSFLPWLNLRKKIYDRRCQKIFLNFIPRKNENDEEEIMEARWTAEIYEKYLVSNDFSWKKFFVFSELKKDIKSH